MQNSVLVLQQVQVEFSRCASTVFLLAEVLPPDPGTIPRRLECQVARRVWRETSRRPSVANLIFFGGVTPPVNWRLFVAVRRFESYQLV
jgi:hypothetical protein